MTKEDEDKEIERAVGSPPRERLLVFRQCYGRTLIRDLIGRLGPNQELRIVPIEGLDRLDVRISNQVILSGEREVITSLLEDGYSEIQPNPNQYNLPFNKDA